MAAVPGCRSVRAWRDAHPRLLKGSQAEASRSAVRTPALCVDGRAASSLHRLCRRKARTLTNRKTRFPTHANTPSPFPFLTSFRSSARRKVKARVGGTSHNLKSSARQITKTTERLDLFPSPFNLISCLQKEPQLKTPARRRRQFGVPAAGAQKRVVARRSSRKTVRRARKKLRTSHSTLYSPSSTAAARRALSRAHAQWSRVLSPSSLSKPRDLDSTRTRCQHRGSWEDRRRTCQAASSAPGVQSAHTRSRRFSSATTAQLCRSSLLFAAGLCSFARGMRYRRAVRAGVAARPCLTTALVRSASPRDCRL
ncbi:hypothetical protein HPB51_010159 [Rhipicephalus microplus]|uniref:Uncharacterized protein n=1 Tax=Rhipicephalus microplus TaxID=6941 RepID=A0A9J6F148_RHIMP|nr:hypothetical protein HPB51_010159 [Rhipicephalus microplus]